MSLQPSVIHNPSTSAQDANQLDEIISEDEARRRREQLNRRPSYRMILKDLETVDKQLKRDPDESNASSAVVHIGAQQPQPSNTPHSSVGSNQNASHMTDQRSSIPSRLDHSPYVPSSGLHGSNGELTLNTIGGIHVGGQPIISQYSPASVAAVAAAAAAAASRGPTTPKSQDLVSSSGPSTVGRMLPVSPDALSIKSMSDAHSFVSGRMSPTDWQSNIMPGYNSSPSPLGMAGGSRGADNDDSTRKRQVRLLKNREAAKECRRKKKEYVKCLENRVSVLENQNKALIEELKTLKELYCRKEKTEL